MDITYNKKQLQAKNKISEFIEQTKYKYFYLFGYAGTGKTFIISKIINDLIKKNKIEHVYLCAPTHKALNVLESYFKSGFSPEETVVLGPKMSFMTIHKLLAFKPVISVETGTKMFKATTESKFLKHFSNKLIVMDECSMLSAEMSKEINKYLELYPLKIIFMGDRAQLPPVSEPESQIFASVPTDYEYTVTLTEVMRTKSADIIAVSQIMRQWDISEQLETILNTMIPIHKKENSRFKMYHHKDKLESSNWFKRIMSVIKSNKVPPIILTWTNQMTRIYNERIRAKLHGITDLDTFVPGDYAMFNKYHSTPDGKHFYTCDTVKITQINTETKIIFDWTTAKLEKCINKTETAYNALVRKFAIFDHTLTINKITVTRIRSDFLEISAPDNSDEIVILSIAEQPANLDKYKYLIKNIQEQLEFFFKKYNSERISSKLWDIFHKNLINPYAELTFGYATTIHKSQGSTFGCVFVDIADASKNNNMGELSKALYTAITRTSDTLYFIL